MKKETRKYKKRIPNLSHVIHRFRHNCENERTKEKGKNLKCYQTAGRRSEGNKGISWTRKHKMKKKRRGKQLKKNDGA